jgi:hypothetical protein
MNYTFFKYLNMIIAVNEKFRSLMHTAIHYYEDRKELERNTKKNDFADGRQAQN